MNINTEQKTNNVPKIAVVFLASSGLGEATAALLVHKGFVVYGFDSSWEQEGIHKNVVRVHVNLGDINSTQSALKEIIDLYGGIDVFVNITNTEFDKITTVDQVVNQQFVYPAILSQFVAQSMRATKKGTIVNVSSFVPEIEEESKSPFYSACKVAMVAFGKAIKSKLLEDGVRICTVHRGPVRYRVRKSKVNNIDRNSDMEIAKTILRAIASKTVLDMYTVGY
ncbi:MAG: SDR family oxidoreductase [Firmicutes bacterium]|nr:SDR family oxidoreductase [Bacillota bacterium]MCL1953723.1 SDR family oxidoreductase [Bacillota bacterium]